MRKLTPLKPRMKRVGKEKALKVLEDIFSMLHQEVVAYDFGLEPVWKPGAWREYARDCMLENVAAMLSCVLSVPVTDVAICIRCGDYHRKELLVDEHCPDCRADLGLVTPKKRKKKA